MKKVSTALFIFFVAVVTKTMGGPTLASCQCQWAGKNYDPAKGYFYDRISYFPYPHVSAHFACVYECKSPGGESLAVSKEYSGSYLGTTIGGVHHAKDMICPQNIAKFIPRFTDGGLYLDHYDWILVGPFSAKDSVVPEIRQWAAAAHCFR